MHINQAGKYSDALADARIAIHAAVAAAHHAAVSIVTAVRGSETLRNSNDAEKTTTSDTYVKKKEVLLNADLDGCRIKFDLYGQTSNNAATKGRIYKNGSPIGVERYRSGATTGWTTYDEDFTGFSSGDLIQIYIHREGPVVNGRVRNMRFYYSEKITDIGSDELETDLYTTVDPSMSMTNQDP